MEGNNNSIIEALSGQEALEQMSVSEVDLVLWIY